MEIPSSPTAYEIPHASIHGMETRFWNPGSAVSKVQKRGSESANRTSVVARAMVFARASGATRQAAPPTSGRSTSAVRIQCPS